MAFFKNKKMEEMVGSLESMRRDLEEAYLKYHKESQKLSDAQAEIESLKLQNEQLGGRLRDYEYEFMEDDRAVMGRHIKRQLNSDRPMTRLDEDRTLSKILAELLSPDEYLQIPNGTEVAQYFDDRDGHPDLWHSRVILRGSTPPEVWDKYQNDGDRKESLPIKIDQYAACVVYRLTYWGKSWVFMISDGADLFVLPNSRAKIDVIRKAVIDTGRRFGEGSPLFFRLPSANVMTGMNGNLFRDKDLEAAFKTMIKSAEKVRTWDEMMAAKMKDNGR